jgi:hypothetical protein
MKVTPRIKINWSGVGVLILVLWIAEILNKSYFLHQRERLKLGVGKTAITKGGTAPFYSELWEPRFTYLFKKCALFSDSIFRVKSLEMLRRVQLRRIKVDPNSVLPDGTSSFKACEDRQVAWLPTCVQQLWYNEEIPVKCNKF